MGEVYKNAICNIAATGAVQREDGCFLPRTEDPLMYTPLIIRATWKTSELMTALPGWYVGEVMGMWRREVLDAPLNHRAWVLQERLLSPRVLHFGARQILWECDRLAACEIYPVEFTTQLRSSQTSSMQLLYPNSSLDPGDIPLDWNKYLQVYNTWTQIVEIYNACAITKNTDRLLALAGEYIYTP